MKILEIAVGVVFAPAGSSLVRISVQTETLTKEIWGWGPKSVMLLI